MSKSTNNQKFEALFHWGASKNLFEFKEGRGWFSKSKKSKDRIEKEIENDLEKLKEIN